MLPDPFDRAVAFVLAHEGEWGTVPGDPGGRTRWGISARAYPGLDLDTLTREQARVIYRSAYWDRCRCDRLPWPVALVVFDGAVQHGPVTMVAMLQRLLHVDPDGVVGPVTLAALQGWRPADLLDDLCVQRALLYDALDRRHRGWYRRLFALHRLGCAPAPRKET